MMIVCIGMVIGVIILMQSEIPEGTCEYSEAMDNEFVSGTRAIEGIIVWEGKDYVSLWTADETVYRFFIGTASRPDSYNEGDYVKIEYIGSLDAPEVASMVKY